MGQLIRSAVHTVLRNRNIWFLLYLMKLCLAALGCFPLLIAVNGSLETSRFANRLQSTWSLDVLGELIGIKSDLVPMVIALIVLVAIAAFVLRQFFNGGIFRRFLHEGAEPFKGFFADGAELFGDNLRISILLVPIYFGLLVVALVSGSIIPKEPFRQFGAVSLYPLFLRFAALYPFLILGSIVSDLMRYRLAAFADETVFARFRWSLNVFRRSFVKLNVLYYVFFTPYVAIWIVVEWATIQITGTLASSLGVLVELGLFQLCSFLRTGQSLLGTAAIGRLLRDENTASMGVYSRNR